MTDGAATATKAATLARPAYRRILLKISGEALMGPQQFGLHPPTVERIAEEVAELHRLGVEIAMVIGGGNIFRGLQGSAQGMERTTADYMGMLATVMNALAMQSALETIGRPHPRGLGDPDGPGLRALYPPPRGAAPGEGPRGDLRRRHRQPLFHHRHRGDAARREMSCEALFKGTQVDGVYDSDPRKNPEARRFDRISYDTVLQKHLKVMDAAAIALARDNGLPIVVFALDEPNGLAGIVQGRGRFTIVEPG